MRVLAADAAGREHEVNAVAVPHRNHHGVGPRVFTVRPFAHVVIVKRVAEDRKLRQSLIP